MPSVPQINGRSGAVDGTRVHGQRGNTIFDRSESDIDPNIHSRFRIVAFYFAVALVFVRFGLLHELLTHQFGINLYPLYVLGIPAIAGVLFTGGLKRTFQFRPAKYWMGFAFWLIPSTIFSTWRGGSIDVTSDYYRTSLIMLFVIGGLAVTWRECKVLLYTIAGAALAAMVFAVRFGEHDESGRMRLPFGAIANSNDYACHLILLLPFVLWVILISQSWWKRLLGFLVFGFGVYQVLASGSRGAMLGTVGGILLYCLLAPAKQRRMALIAAPVVLAAALTMLPSTTVKRIFTFTAAGGEDNEALESSRDRERLLMDSISMTIRHPLLGVGPGQFANIEGQQTTAAGRKLWYEAHNSFTKASSETGIPGLIFFAGGIISSLILLRDIGRKCSDLKDCSELSKAVLCSRIALSAYSVTISFINFSYMFSLPAFASFVIAMAWAQRTKEILNTNNIVDANSEAWNERRPTRKRKLSRGDPH